MTTFFRSGQNRANETFNQLLENEKTLRNRISKIQPNTQTENFSVKGKDEKSSEDGDSEIKNRCICQ